MKEWLYIIFELPRQLFKIYVSPILKRLFKRSVEATSQKSDEIRNKTEALRCLNCNMYKKEMCRLYNKKAYIAVVNCKEYYEKTEKVTKDNRLNIPPTNKRH